MALVKCPECGRENVSSAATACPSCGYNIKGHFEKIKIKKMAKKMAEKQKKNAEASECEIDKMIEKIREERINSIPLLEEPDLANTRNIFLIILTIIIGMITMGNIITSDSEITIAWIIAFVIASILLAISTHSSISEYQLCQNDPRAYREKIYDEKYRADEAQYIKNYLSDELYHTGSGYVTNGSHFAVECPYCHSINTTKITAVEKGLNIFLFGLFGNKRRYQWHCNKCGSNF